MTLVFSINFSQKYCFIGKWQHFFHFSYVFLYFVGILSMCLDENRNNFISGQDMSPNFAHDM